MAYKLIVLAPSTGGKSTLMRYLRENTKLNTDESDEAVLEANNNAWPDDDQKNKVLIPQTTQQIINLPDVVYLASYIPDDLLVLARENGFVVILVNFAMETLSERNKARIEAEGYEDVSPWFQMQRDNFESLKTKGLIDKTIDGTKSIEELASQIASYAESQLR